MRLQTWREGVGKERADVARACGVTAEAVRLWEVGERMPRRDQMATIAELSGGQVTPNDFFDIEAAQ